MRQAVEGLLYLHSHGILHRDLTLANLLLTNDMDAVRINFHQSLIKKYSFVAKKELEPWATSCSFVSNCNLNFSSYY